MGTSASGSGAGGGNPLIPTWIGGGGILPPELPPTPPDQENGQGDQPQQGNGADDEDQVNNNGDDRGQNNYHINVQSNINAATASSRYRQPRIQFNRYISSGGRDRQALKNALRTYSRHAAGGTRQMARRMTPAVSRVVGFYEVINTVKERGKQGALTYFNLINYKDKPVFEILSALTDIIFNDTGKIYEDTQDDAIAKYAWCNTINRISELEGIDLDNLTNDQVEVMMATFIEETIAQRVINDIGDKLTKKNPNLQELRDIEDSIYQIVSGMVRNVIMPEVIATQRGDKANIENRIENIYRLAFDAMAGIND